MSRQEIYEYYMNDITIYFSKIQQVESNFIKDVLEKYMRFFYRKMFDVFKERGFLTQDEIENEELYKNHRYYVVRDVYIQTPLYLTHYPNLWNIFKNSLNDMKINQLKYSSIISNKLCFDKLNKDPLYILCQSDNKCEEKDENCEECFLLKDKNTISLSDKIANEQIIPTKCFISSEQKYMSDKSFFVLVLDDDDSYLSGNIVLSSITYDVNYNVIQLLHTSPVYFQHLFNMIAALWNSIEYNSIYENNKEELKKLCYKVHWLFANTAPFFRGSASVAKILLNACLIKCGLNIVKESRNYHAQSDWIALLCPNFELYYQKIFLYKVFEELDSSHLSQFSRSYQHPKPRYNPNKSKEDYTDTAGFRFKISKTKSKTKTKTKSKTKTKTKSKTKNKSKTKSKSKTKTKSKTKSKTKNKTKNKTKSKTKNKII